MDKQVREVVLSKESSIDLKEIFEYGKETFGLRAAESFLSELIFRIQNLAVNYELYSECKHLPTKSRKYRNFILGSYLIIYRITSERIEVLRVYHGSKSLAKIKSAKSIKPE